MPPETDDTPTAIQRLKASSVETQLLRTAVGTFDVHTRIWPAEGAEPPSMSEYLAVEYHYERQAEAVAQ